jgi:hypothetical protein
MKQRLAHIALICLVSTLLFYPTSDWILSAWKNSPLDSTGRYQFILGIFWSIMATGLMKPETMPGIDLKAIPFFLVSLLVLAGALILDINSMAVYASLLSILSFIWLIKGTRIAVVAFPGIGMAFLSAPTAVYFLDQLRLLAGINILDAKNIQVIASLLVLLITPLAILIAKKANSAGNKGMLAGYLFSVSIFAGGLIAGQTTANVGPPYHLALENNMLQDWLGADISLTPAEQHFFSGANYQKRVYAKPDGKAVAILTISTDDMHRLHTPEYCWTGGGWQVTQRQSLPPEKDFNPLPAAVTYLTLKRNNTELSLLYWFSDQNHSTGEISDLRLTTPFNQRQTTRLFIVSSLNPNDKNHQQTVTDFLSISHRLSEI